MTITEPVGLRAPEVRTYAELEIREVDSTESGSHIEGLAVPYDSWSDVGWFMEQFSRGSLSRSIKEAAKGLPLHLWHDKRSFPIGISTEWRDTDEGLRGVWRIDQDDEMARTAARKAAGGFFTGLSIGFAPIAQETMTDEKGLMWVTRTEARLLEVSMTTVPVYDQAGVTLVRSRVPHPAQGKPARRSAELDAWKTYMEGIKR